MKKIVGVTLGPILETIAMSEKISEIANSSLFFSTLMYEFLSEIKGTDEYEIITPYFEDFEKNSEKLFPDRAILEVKNSELEEKDILEKIEEIENKILNSFNGNIKKYINFNTVIMKIENEEEIEKIFSKLDGIELIKNFPIKYSENEIISSIEKYNASEIKKLSSKKYKVHQKKYRAVISIDLDNMGKFSQEEISQIKKVSKKINEYILGLKKFIENKKYRNASEGIVLYSAGDDILAILNPKHVFSFIKESCELLNKIFQDLPNKELSVSFGIFICYEKSPMKESIEKAHELLFTKAKNRGKNSAVILVQKHSGKSFELILDNLIIKNTDKKNEFNSKNIHFNKLEIFTRNDVNDVRNNSNNQEKINILFNTIIQKMYLNAFVFNEIIDDEIRIRRYLDTLFDIKGEKEKKIINILYELLINIKKRRGKEAKAAFKEEMEMLISVFKMMKFYTDKE